MANIYRETLSLTASTAAASATYSEHMTGILMGLTLKKGTASGSTNVLTTLSVWGSSNQAIWKGRAPTTEKFFRPSLVLYKSSDTHIVGSSIYILPPLCRDRVKVNMAASTSSGKKTMTLVCYIDGPPGLQGSSN